MSHFARGFARKASLAVATALLLAASAGFAPTIKAQTPAAKDNADTSSKQERWLHVRVEGDTKDELVRVNVPLELAEAILPTINKDRLDHGKVHIDKLDTNGVDLHALMNAVRNAKDGEFVTVQSKDSDVRVAKQNGYLVVHVLDHSRDGDKTKKDGGKKSQVEVKVPMKVVDALFSAGKDELDLVAAIHALSAQGDTELVSVKDSENTVRVWLDAKNTSN
jgi:hypothetical protein